jgi:hypothetical protein
MSEKNIEKKKRGRKPKMFTMINKIEQPIVNNINTEEEKIILHLPVTINEINNSYIINDNNDYEMDDIFIKSENNINNNCESDATENLKINYKNNYTSSEECGITQKTPNKILSQSLSFNKNTKCWWCRNNFDSPPVQLPEDYYEYTFYCIGHFCSFNCTKSYNLDLNDSLTWKRESLLNLFYYQTYSENKYIHQAPHWMTLIEYGGYLTIQEFRENSLINTKEYLVLHPPLISRQMQIEESYKINKLKEVPIEKLNKLYSDVQCDSEYIIKRTKPIQASQLNLATTMGLIKSKKK